MTLICENSFFSICLRLTVEPTCSIRMGYKCKHTTHSCPILVHSTVVLRSSLLSQRSHSPHRQHAKLYSAHCPWMIASHSNGILTDSLGIQLAELHRQAALSIANRTCLDPDHIFHGQLNGSQNVSKEILISKRPFVKTARKL